MSDLPEVMTIEVKPPVEFKGRTYAEIVVREPTAKQVRQAEQNMGSGVTMGSMRNRKIWLVSLAADIPVPAVEMMPISAVERAAAYLEGFINAGLETGAS